MRKRLLILTAVCMSVLVWGQKKAPSAPVAHIKISDVFVPAPYGSVHIGGYLGDKLDLCMENRIMAQDVDRVVQPFFLRNDGNWGFRSDFWGKWVISAMLGCDHTHTGHNCQVIDSTVDDLLKSQTPDGYIGTYPDEHHLGDWDIWGRKNVLLALLAYHDRTKDAKALEAAKKHADLLIREAGEGSGVNVAATGWIGWKGLASSSVIESIALLYQKTGEQRYLDFAQYVIRSWDSPNKLSPTGVRLIQEALSGTPLWEMSGVPKAYEMMTCFEGLCEMYRSTGESLYLDACRTLVNTIIRDEIMIVGSGSMAEIWCNGKKRQGDPIYQGMETCVTVTWMKLLYQMLRLTGDCQYADQLEISLYNALLSAQTPKGEWWAYYTNLMGERVPSHLQFPDVVMSCCVASGPWALLQTPSWAAMTATDGLILNLYGQVDVAVKTPAGQNLSVKMETDYPVGGKVSAMVRVPKKELFAIRLRIPEWSKDTKVTVNGKPYDGYLIPGTYASLRREWSNDDRIDIAFDMRARVVDTPSGLNDAAIMRGPIVLAFDTRLVPFRTYVEVPPMYRYKFLRNTDNETIEVKLVENPEVPAIWMTFDVPVADEGGGKHVLQMCDYTSAGNTWEEGNLFRVWIPQPFDFRHLYVNKLDWRTNISDKDERPVIPELYKK